MFNNFKKLIMISIFISPLAIWLFISGHWGFGILLICMIILSFLINYINNSKSKINLYNIELSNPSEKRIEANNINITETCPHCKNPNTKRTRICEWCGNQII